MLFVLSITLCMVIKMPEEFANYSVGKRVRSLRKKYGLSQESLALKADITPAYLGQIERGKKHPTVVTVEKVCRSFNISLSEFFQDAAEPVSQTDAFQEQIAFELKDCTDDEKKEIIEIIRHALKLRHY